MEIQEFKWASSSRSISIHAERHLPDGDPKAVFVMVHSIGCNSECLKDMRNLFLKNRFAVYSIDARGHGKSDGPRGRYGFSKATADLNISLSIIRKLYPALPIVVFGHGAGAIVAVHQVLEYIPNLQGLILTAPWFRVRYVAQPWKVFFSRFVPWMIYDNELKRGEFAKENVAVNTVQNIKGKGHFSLKHFYRVNVPMLVMFGEEDEIISFRSAKEYVKNAGDFAELKIWEDKGHNLHQEIPEEMMSHILDWLERGKILTKEVPQDDEAKDKARRRRNY